MCQMKPRLKRKPPLRQRSDARSTVTARQADSIECGVLAHTSGRVKRYLQFVGFDTEEVQVEQRVEVCSKQEAVDRRIVCHSSIWGDVSGFDNREDLAPSDQTARTVALTQGSPKCCLSSPKPDRSVHGFWRALRPCIALDSIGDLSASFIRIGDLGEIR